VTTVWILSNFDWNLSALFYISAQTLRALPDSLLGRCVLGLRDGAYDGESYYLMAIDPFNTHSLYRSGHSARILLPWLSNALAFGVIHWIPKTYYLINLSAMLVGAFYFEKLMKAKELSSWLFGFCYLNLGLLTAFRFNCVEPLAIALLISGCWYRKSGRWMLSAILFALSVLARDTFVVLFAVGFVVSVVTKKKTDMVVFGIGVIPYLFLPHLGGNSVVDLLSIYHHAWLRMDISGWASGINSLLFIPYVLTLLYTIYHLLRDSSWDDPCWWMVMVYLIWIGLGNPTAAWSNVTGIARHLVPAIVLIPFILKNKSIGLRLAAIYGAWNLVLVGWLWLKLSRSYEVFNCSV